MERPRRSFRLPLPIARGSAVLGMLLLVAVGFVTSFIFGWIVVKTFLGYVAKHGFGLFVWWRVIVGTLGLIGLALLG